MSTKRAITRANNHLAQTARHAVELSSLGFLTLSGGLGIFAIIASRMPKVEDERDAMVAGLLAAFAISTGGAACIYKGVRYAQKTARLLAKRGLAMTFATAAKFGKAAFYAVAGPVIGATAALTATVATIALWDSPWSFATAAVALVAINGTANSILRGMASAENTARSLVPA